MHLSFSPSNLSSCHSLQACRDTGLHCTHSSHVVRMEEDVTAGDRKSDAEFSLQIIGSCLCPSTLKPSLPKGGGGRVSSSLSLWVFLSLTNILLVLFGRVQSAFKLLVRISTVGKNAPEFHVSSLLVFFLFVSWREGSLKGAAGCVLSIAV